MKVRESEIVKQKRFMDLFESEENRLERYCLILSKNREEAKDLMGETILQAYVRFDTIRDARKFPNYLFTIAKRLYLKRIRNWWRFQIDRDAFLSIEDLTPDASLLVDFKILKQAIAKLPDKLKQAVVLHEISGFSMKEIAEMEGCSLAAAKVRVMRGRNKLNEILKE